MYLFVTQNGGKYFRLDYRFLGKRKTLALGVYPETSLKEARIKRDEARKLLSDSIDPFEAKKARKLKLITETNNSFEAIAAEWHAKMKSKWSEGHAQRKWHLLETNVFPCLVRHPSRV